VRAGGQTLTLLGAPRTFLILESLAEGPKGQFELRRDAGSPAQSTLRGHLRTLETAGAIARRRRDSFPGALEFTLEESGQELLDVAVDLQRWLSSAPGGPLELGGDAAKAAIKGLVEGWNTTVLTTLAAGPLSLTEMDKRIGTVSYPTIERCLETMRLADQLEVGVRSNKGTPHAVTEWLRRGVGPLTLGARWEHRRKPEGALPIHRPDVEGAFSLVAPLLDLSARRQGICHLSVRLPDGDKRQRFTGFVEVRGKQAVLGGVHPQTKPDAWASGGVEDWFSALTEANGDLKISGKRELAQALLGGVHRTLFADEADKNRSDSRIPK